MTQYLTSLLLLSAAMALTACGNNEATPQPGEYQQSVKITAFDFPGVASDAKAEMIRQMEEVGSGVGSKFCMSAEQGASQWKEAASQMAGALGGKCDTIRDEGSTNMLDLEMLCKETVRGDVTVTMTGSARNDGYDSEMSFNIVDPGTGETTNLAMNIGAKRMGDCES